MAPKNEVLEWRGQTMVGSSGDKIGKIAEIHLDTESELPEWALVHTGLFGSAASFVPIADASSQGGNVQVPFDKAQVKDAPKLDPDGELSQQDGSALYSHYDLTYGDERSSGDPTPSEVGNDVSGSETYDAITRSEEELSVGTTQR
jgi:hypothetical protein